jgi:23S rRNA (cytosine1962-C5)-methyltransferase
MHIPILFQDEDLLVVDKPAGLLTHPDDSSAPEADVVSVLRRQLGREYLGLHHRLDREVSGVLLFAARREANAALARAFEGREAHKGYVAVVRGAPRQRQGTLDAPLRKVRSGLWAAASRRDRSALRAQTHYRLLQSGPGGAYSLLELLLETGRTHQIRVHLAHAGCPIVGDELYGDGDSFPRLLLHAESLGLQHPSSGAPCRFTAPWPAIFERARAGLHLPELELAKRKLRGGLADLRPRDRAALDGLLELAAQRRAPLEASEDQTDLYRLVHGAGDGLPGLELDRHGEALFLRQAAGPGPRPALPPVLREALAGIWPGWPLAEGRETELTVREAGLLYRVQPAGPAWAKLRPALREVRQRVAERAAGLAVLCCFSGGGAFGLVAAAGGARRLVHIDPAAAAHERLQQALEANGLEPAGLHLVAEPAMPALRRLARARERFDLVLLDVAAPGRPAQRGADDEAADLAAVAGTLLVPGGALLACIEAPALPRRLLRDTLLEALGGARAARVAGAYHEPAIDFPRPLMVEVQPAALAYELAPARGWATH